MMGQKHRTHNETNGYLRQINSLFLDHSSRKINSAKNTMIYININIQVDIIPVQTFRY